MLLMVPTPMVGTVDSPAVVLPTPRPGVNTLEFEGIQNSVGGIREPLVVFKGTSYLV